ncbi:MAG: carbamoyltransferase HypF [bacterium]|nr:MAG: carbamoyltransferase HypF [bacterium]
MDWKKGITDLAIRNDPARIRLTVRGRVQGVGFRPAIYRLAREMELAGFVRNTRRGVVIELEGSIASIERFGENLATKLPPLARIDSVDAAELATSGTDGFTVESSEEPGHGEALYPVDTAVCADCLLELRDPDDKRYRYPFINCTNCGPRFTLIEGLPYDRPLTTMREFEMDPFCRAQYLDPADRRFHAEPISCPDCGPRLILLDARGEGIPGEPLSEARRMIEDGAIVAVKGLGGYHLACLATETEVVERLRRRKGRPAKPFAVMFRDLDAIERYCRVDESERRLLLSPESPIVLLRRAGRTGATEPRLPVAVAPRNAYIGVFLPYTPIHHMLMEGFEVLVMTSANFTDEPLISDETELTGILGRIADAALVHNRRISHKCDDSIYFVPAGEVVPIRRARGFVPEPVTLYRCGDAPLLALGGQEKGTFALGSEGKAFLSPHLGDLGDYRSQANYRRELDDFKRLLAIEPEVCINDLHPDYFTSRLAAELACPVTVAVQHHHAHAVSVMAEYGLDEPVIGVTFDGTGFGSDGRLWGGEILLARYADFRRLAHIKYLPLPGGEAAIREPWRMALMHLWNLHGDLLLDRCERAASMFEGLPAAEVLALAQRGINAPLTSSIGRLFDAVAFVLGCGHRVSYEAEAAVALEELAVRHGPTERCYVFGMEEGDVVVIEPAPVFEAILQDLGAGVSASEIASAFHNTVACLIVELAGKLARREACGEIVLSGGVFQNRFLLERLVGNARQEDCRWYQHRLMPPNDGGLSLGQVQIGAARIEKGLI